jgi:hypothetical protein
MAVAKMERYIKLTSLAEINRVIAEAPGTLTESRASERYFTRKRKMNFKDLLWYLLNQPKCSTQTALNRFWETLGKKGTPMSQQAFSKARDHFNHTPFEKMFRAVVEEQYSGKYDPRTWNGLMLMAVDGTHISLPAVGELREYFGVTGKGATSPTALGSVLYDVTNDMLVDAVIGSSGDSERDYAKLHLRRLGELKLTETSVVIFDRGYPSLDFIKVMPQGLRFVMRVCKNWRKPVNEATAPDSVVTLDDGCDLRVIKFMLPSGEKETLITNMFDLPASDFPALYFKRWPVETKFDIVKNKLELENFTGRTVNSIMQDFWAAMHVTNMVAVAKHEAEELVKEQRKEKNIKYDYVPNTNQLIGSLKDKLVIACLAPNPRTRGRLLDKLIVEISRAVIPIRPGRSLPRSKYPREVNFHHNHKSNL